MNPLVTTLRCRWAARRIGRYLDADPSGGLSPAEVARLERHLAVCERCQQTLGEHRALSRALARWSGTRMPDEAALARLHHVVDELGGGGAHG